MTRDAEGAPVAQPSLELDCRGLYCPLPILRTREALETLASGEVVKVVATDPAAEVDMMVFSAQSGHSIVAQVRDSSEFVFFVRKA